MARNNVISLILTAVIVLRSLACSHMLFREAPTHFLLELPRLLSPAL
jgi:hypothetical protein